MKKNLNLIIILVSLLILCLTSNLNAKINTLSGIPEDTPFLFHILFEDNQKSALSTIIDQIKNNDAFKTKLLEFKDRTNIEIKDEIFEIIKSLNSFSLAAFLNIKDFKQQPDVLLCVKLNDENLATKLNNILKEIMINFAKKNNKELEFKNVTDNMFEYSIPTIKDQKDNAFNKFEPRIFKFKNYTGLFIYQKYNKTRSDKIFKSVIEAFKNDKITFINKSQIKNNIEALNKSNILFYLDGQVYREGAIHSGYKEESDLVKYVLFTSNLSSDFKSLISNLIVSLKEPQDKATLLGRSNILKNLITYDKTNQSNIHISELLPNNICTFFNLKFYFNENSLKLMKPALDAQKSTISMMFGVSLENDIFSWISGDFFVALTSNTPNFYIGIGSKNLNNTWNFVEKFEKILKIAGAPFNFQNAEIDGIKVKISPLTTLEKYIKNANLVLGCVNNYLIITSSQDAFKSLVNSSKNKQESLANNVEFKNSVVNYTLNSFLGIYINFPKVKEVVKSINEQAEKMFHNLLNLLTLNASCDGKTILLDMKLEVNPENFVLKFLDNLLTSAKIKEKIEELKTNK